MKDDEIRGELLRVNRSYTPAIQPLPAVEFGPEGIKYDNEKLDWSLVPFNAMEGAIRVLQHGAKKYKPDNWKFVEPIERYYNAAMRHLTAIFNGELKDPDTGELHASHLLCNALFIVYKQEEMENEQNQSST